MPESFKPWAAFRMEFDKETTERMYKEMEAFMRLPLFIVVNIGCIHCPVDSHIVGVYRTREGAEAAKVAEEARVEAIPDAEYEKCEVRLLESHLMLNGVCDDIGSLTDEYLRQKKASDELRNPHQ